MKALPGEGSADVLFQDWLIYPHARFLIGISEIQSDYLMVNLEMKRVGCPCPSLKESGHFQGGSADYGPKSICRYGWISFGDGHLGRVTSPIIIRNVQSFGRVPSILTMIDSLFGGH